MRFKSGCGSIEFMKYFISATIAFACAGCATMGAPFQFKGPDTIVKGKTTQNEILKQYGTPFRVGYENGDAKWTYGYYKYRFFGDSETKDLDITFGKNGIVSSYTYSTSVPEEVNAAKSNQ
jgi:hypothetical protein